MKFDSAALPAPPQRAFVPFAVLLSGICLADLATNPIVLLSVDRNLRAVAANSPADAARLQQEEHLRNPGVRRTPIAPKTIFGRIGSNVAS